MLISEAPQISGLLTLEMDTKREESGPVANLRISGLADLEIFITREERARQASRSVQSGAVESGACGGNLAIDQKVAAVISHS